MKLLNNCDDSLLKKLFPKAESEKESEIKVEVSELVVSAVAEMETEELLVEEVFEEQQSEGDDFDKLFIGAQTHVDYQERAKQRPHAAEFSTK